MDNTYVISLVAVEEKDQIREDQIGGGEDALESSCGRVLERHHT